jgi:hypothetical protein
MLKQLLTLSLLVGCSTTSQAAPPLALAPVAAAQPSTTTVLELAQQRATLIGYLHDYREAGVFPRDDKGMPASVFVDAAGVRCPMAELLHKSGRDDLVAAVAKEANTVRLADVRSGPLHAWMLGSGLTQQEISLVQGAMNISMDWMPVEEHGGAILAGTAAVRAKLEIAEIALRDNTAASLATAAKRLPANAHPEALVAMSIHGAVVPATAIPTVVLQAVRPSILRARSGRY